MHRIGLSLLAFIAPIYAVAELPTGAKILDPDVVWDMWNPESAVLSPDGHQIAYISKGALWVCNVADGPPKKLAELPNTPTDYMARPEFAYARANFELIRTTLGNAVYNPTIGAEEVDVFSLRWTRSQDGVVYSLRGRHPTDEWTVVHRIMHASLEGSVSTISKIERGRFAEPRFFDAFHLTDDHRHLIAWSNRVPLIWDVAANRPRATCFDYLVPAANSERYLGIEIDSRQLVIADRDFQIIRRFEVFLPMGYPSELLWSPDEQFAIWRLRHGHPSNKWVGFRLNLATGDKRSLSGDYFGDTFGFTDHGGELVHIGIPTDKSNGVDGLHASFLSIIPDGAAPSQKVLDYRLPLGTRGPASYATPSYPHTVVNSVGSLFAVPMPQNPKATPRYVYQLIDRTGRQWSFPAENEHRYVTPFDVIAFADRDRTMIARDDFRLYSLPVSAITSEKAKTNE